MSSNRYGHNYFCGTKLDKSVTIASLQAHGVSQLVVYCRGKRNWDWPCHHSGELPLDRFRADEVLGDIERRCRCTACGWRQADVRPDYSRQVGLSQSVDWIMAPAPRRRTSALLRITVSSRASRHVRKVPKLGSRHNATSKFKLVERLALLV
jgi:hypothetical protein